MKQKELSQLTDQELLDEAKKMKSTSIIPLFLAYKLINNSKHNTKELEILLKERNSPL